ncbi:MAG: hypothetical protein AB1442_10675 [Nitrospirota bacterium]
MNIIKLDITGMQWSQAFFKMAAKTIVMQQGDIPEISGSSYDFRQYIDAFCKRIKKEPAYLEQDKDGIKRCHIHF